MENLVVVLPKEMNHLQDDSLPAILNVSIRWEIYLSAPPKPIHGMGDHWLVVLNEQLFHEWFSSLDREQKHISRLVLIEQNGENHSILHNFHVIGWIDQNITKKRWVFLLAQAISNILDEYRIQMLQKEVANQEFELNRLNEIGVALSSEKDLNILLDLIVSKAMELTHADAGSLYLIENIPDKSEDPNNYLSNKRFRFEVAKNQSRMVPFHSFTLDISKKSIYGYVALTGKPLIIEDAYFIDKGMEYSWGGRPFDQKINYRTKSMLSVPMFNHEDTIIGVIQLINCKKYPSEQLGEPHEILDQVVGFTHQNAKATQSIASQAAIALLNARLLESIQNLFDGFINASVKAIESRDPTTSGHSSRVATLTVALGEAVNHVQSGPFGKLYFTSDQLQEIRYASLLHDFGKIGVREHVLVKAKKLYPDEEQAIMDRIRLVRQSIEIELTRKQLNYFLDKSKDEALMLAGDVNRELKHRLDEIDDFLKFIIRCNEPTVMAQGGFERLQEIGTMIFDNPSRIKTPFLAPKEVASLSVARGSLNLQDRIEIESHVTHTFKFLSIIPWTKNLDEVPDIAYAHHEKLDGTGYPRKLKGDEIPVQSRMMTIADIYDALTAWDRPYKKALPTERALNILQMEAKDNHIDKDLLELFIKSHIYQLVARPEAGKKRKSA